MARTLTEILQDEQTFTTVILTVLIDKYGTDMLYWDPVTVGLEIKRDFGFTPDRPLMDKIQAGSLVLINDLFFKSLETFNNLCNVLNIGVFSTDLFIPASLDDCMWGCTEVKLMLGDDYKAEFSHDISNYVGVLLSNEGIYTPPEILKFSEYTTEMQFSDDILAEDEVMYKVFWDRQKEAKKEAEDLLKNRLLALMRQLEELPIEIEKANVQKMIERLSAVS
jgi:hypothetical protein